MRFGELTIGAAACVTAAPTRVTGAVMAGLGAAVTTCVTGALVAVTGATRVAVTGSAVTEADAVAMGSVMGSITGPLTSR